MATTQVTTTPLMLDTTTPVCHDMPDDYLTKMDDMLLSTILLP